MTSNRSREGGRESNCLYHNILSLKNYTLFAFYIDFLSLKNQIQCFAGDGMEFKERLQKLMNARGLNIYGLAKRSGLSWNTVNNFFARDTKPTITTLVQLCEGLGITPAQFFDEEGQTSHLTAEQQLLLDRWQTLSGDEKKIINDLLDVMAGKH